MRHLARVCLMAMLLAWSSVIVAPWTVLAKPIQSDELDRTELPQTAKARGATTTVVADTTWIAEWTFDSESGCDAMGWEVSDNRIVNDGSNYWHLETDFDGVDNIVGQAAVLSKHDLCWVIPDGYGNDWDYSIVCRYVGTGATLSFDYLLDSEPGFDFLLVEADSACSSNDRVDYAENPFGTSAELRVNLFSDSGLETSGSVVSLLLPDFAAPSDTHCVYIRFLSDPAFSPEDGQQPTTLGAALVVDNLQVAGDLSYSENFGDVSLDPNVILANSAPTASFGLWARLHEGITDNDPCTSNPTCAWLFSDPTLPAYTPEMAFGPDGAVVRNWLDNSITSPWVSLAATSDAVGTVVDYRRFFGNLYATSRIVEGIHHRERYRVDNTDTPSPGDSVDCVGPWKLESWTSPASFTWVRRTRDLSVEPATTDIQVRFRVVDWQVISAPPAPNPLDPGPGPFIDDIRIGRRVLSGPVFDVGLERGAAQDNFASTPQPNGHFEPSDDRFGTSDFANPRRHLGGFCLCCGPSPSTWFVTADSVVVWVTDERGVGGITSVDFYGAIVAGPHTGKAPPPFTVAPNGFFHAVADTAADFSGPSPERFFVDLDDDYFRGGDMLVYFWMATDGAGAVASHPAGITTVPGSIAEAEALTGGLLETSFLPTIAWDPAYLARVAADPSGKLEPTPDEISNSSQSTCILYVSTSPNNRRSGDIHRTSFMYTLDQLGYRGKYDVYDHLLAGSTSNNPIGSRATVNAAGGYALIIADAPHGATYLAIPPGACSETFFPQSQWYQQWLAQGAASEVGRAALWVIGDDMAEEWAVPGHVVSTEMAVTLVSDQLNIGPKPEVHGLGAFTWADGSSTDFSADHFVLDAPGACDFAIESYDALGANGTASITHRYEYAGITGDGAVVMNADPAAGWNTVFMSINWDDVLRPGGGPPGTPEADLARRILDGVLPVACQALPDPTTDRFDESAGTAPRKTALYGNAPNPFNPMTTVRFGLARPGHVDMRIYAVSGRLVRRLVNRKMEAAQHRVVWDGRDEAGIDVASGIYVLRLVADGFDGTQKLVVVR